MLPSPYVEVLSIEDFLWLFQFQIHYL